MKKISLTDKEILILQAYLNECNICSCGCVIATSKDCDKCEVTKIINKLKEKLC